MSDLHTSLVETYLHMRTEKLDPVGKEDRDIDNDGDHDKSDKYLLNRRKKITKAVKCEEENEIDEGVYGSGNRKLRPASERRSRGEMTPAMRAAQKRAAKRAQEVEDRADRILADPTVRKQRRLAKPETSTSDTPKSKPRRLPSNATSDPLDDLIKRVRKESYSNWREDLRELVDTGEVDKQLTDKKKNKEV